MRDRKVIPSEIEAHRCPICEAYLIGPREKAEQHVNTPPGRILPAGLIFFDAHHKLTS